MRVDGARKCVPALLVAVFLAAVSCSGADSERPDAAAVSPTLPPPSAPSSSAPASAAPSSDAASPAGGAEPGPLQPDWPLGGIWLASGIDGDGLIADPRLAFTTDDLAVAAVVALGADVPDGATLLVEWFGVALDERTPLFTHEIPVGPGGLAVVMRRRSMWAGTGVLRGGRDAR